MVLIGCSKPHSTPCFQHPLVHFRCPGSCSSGHEILNSVRNIPCVPYSFSRVPNHTSRQSSHLMRHRRFPWCSRSSHRSSRPPSRSGRTHHRIATCSRSATKTFGRLRRVSGAFTHGCSFLNRLDVWVGQGHGCAEEDNGDGGHGETHFGWSFCWFIFEWIELNVTVDVSGI